VPVASGTPATTWAARPSTTKVVPGGEYPSGTPPVDNPPARQQSRVGSLRLEVVPPGAVGVRERHARDPVAGEELTEHLSGLPGCAPEKGLHFGGEPRQLARHLGGVQRRDALQVRELGQFGR
jgi:hypothetical protein